MLFSFPVSRLRLDKSVALLLCYSFFSLYGKTLIFTLTYCPYFAVRHFLLHNKDMQKSTFSPHYDIFKSKLVNMRKAAGLTQRQLAKKLKREHSFVSRIELGEYGTQINTDER